MATFCKKRSGNFFDTLLEFLLAVILAVFVIFDKNPLVSYFALALVALLFVIFLTKNKGIFCLNLEIINNKYKIKIDLIYLQLI